MTADACGRAVIAGPVEASALGNAMMQALATGHLKNLSEGQEALRRSVELRSYEPAQSAATEQAYERYNLWWREGGVCAQRSTNPSKQAWTGRSTLQPREAALQIQAPQAVTGREIQRVWAKARKRARITRWRHTQFLKFQLPPRLRRMRCCWWPAAICANRPMKSAGPRRRRWKSNWRRPSAKRASRCAALTRSIPR